MPQFHTTRQILELSLRKFPSRSDLRKPPNPNMADVPRKEAAPTVLPDRTVPEKPEGTIKPADMAAARKVSTIKPSLLVYLKEIASGVRRLSEEQMVEIRECGLVNDERGEVDKVELNVLLDFMTRQTSHAMKPLGERDLDLSHPISSYFISSSHNTYLSGNQLYGDASAEAYKNVRLLKVKRVVDAESKSHLGPTSWMSLCGNRRVGWRRKKASERSRGE